MVKCPKTIVCNSCHIVNDFEYDDKVLSQNEELYDFTTSYFVAESAFDENDIEKMTKKCKATSQLIMKNETGKLIACKLV